MAGYDEARAFVSRLKLALHAASLGGVETLASLAILSSHRGQPQQNLDAAGISVGIEDPDDIWSDFANALS